MIPSLGQRLKYWMASLPIALLVPSCIWLVIGLSTGALSSNFSPLIPLVVMFTLVHLAGYAVIGFPIFLSFYGKAESRVLTWRWGLLLGAFAGFLIAECILRFDGMQSRPHGDVIGAILVGILYGAITAVAALWVRGPKIVRNTTNRNAPMPEPSPMSAFMTTSTITLNSKPQSPWAL